MANTDREQLRIFLGETMTNSFLSEGKITRRFTPFQVYIKPFCNFFMKLKETEKHYYGLRFYRILVLIL